MKQSRMTANIRHKQQNEDKQHKKNHNAENQNDEQHGSHQKTGGKPGCLGKV